MNMERHGSVCFLVLAIGILSSGCADRPEFLVCPSEYASEMHSVSASGRQREVLFRDRGYAILIFETDVDGNYVPVQHYRSEHTFTSRKRPELVTWNKPLHVSTIVIIDSPEDGVAIAVRKAPEPGWREYRTRIENRKGGGEIDVLYIPPFESLKPIPDARRKHR